MQRRIKKRTPYRQFGQRRGQFLTPIEEKVKSTEDDKDDANKEQDNTSEITNWRKPNWEKISALGNWGNVLVAAVLAFFTYQLYLRTKEANTTSSNALLQATRANDISERSLNASMTQNRLRDSTDSISQIWQGYKDSVTIALAQKSLQTQIGSIKQTQRQFDVQLRPVLDVTNFAFRNLQPDTRPVIQFDIVNLGRAPAKVTKTNFGFHYLPKVDFNPETYLSRINSPEASDGSYITYQPKREVFTAFSIMPKAQYEQAIKQELVMILFGEVKYINEIDGQPRKLVFSAVLYPPPRFEYKTVYLLNTDSK